MKLIIAEKPDVARQIVNAIASDAKFHELAKGTYGKMGYYANSEYVICSSVGHIVEILKPNEMNPKYNWNIDSLPYDLPDELPTQVSKDKKNIFNTIQKTFNAYKYDEIIIATDGDREGQNIWRKIKKHLKKYSIPETRVWLDEWTKEGIEEAIKNRFPNSQKENLGLAAQCREEMDWKWGMEGTVACTKKYATKFGEVLSIGRVMTPTMKFVYDRENEINNFIPKPYKVLSITTETDEKEHLTLKHQAKKDVTIPEIDDIYEELKKTKKCTLYKESKKTTKKCPELYDATTIMQDMNKRYGYSAKETSDIIQKLYQTYVLTTYPGTNDTKISEGTAKNATDALKNLTSLYNDEIEEIIDNKWTVSKHVITSEELPHEAITPVFGTAHIENISKLSEKELNVYKAICERFLAVFYPNAEFEEITITADINKEKFKATGKRLLNEGWTKVLGTGKDIILPNVTSGKEYSILSVDSEEKMTTPPSRYNEETLLEAMKNAGRFVDDKEDKDILKQIEGIGTGRTRAPIIENIKNKQYFEIKKKTIYPTEKCIRLFDCLPKDSIIVSPLMTAKNEQMLMDVENGLLSREDCMKQMDNQLFDFIDEIKNDSTNTMITKTTNTLGYICPLCGKNIIEKANSYTCETNKYIKKGNDFTRTEGCGFLLSKTIAKKKLSEKNVKELFEKNETSLIKGFTGSKGKFDAKLELKTDGKIGFEFK